MMTNNLNQLGQIVALLSFVIGTSILSFYLYFGEGYIDLEFSAAIVTGMVIINFIVFVAVVIGGLFNKNKKEALKTCFIMCLNIPVAILYLYMIITFP